MSQFLNPRLHALSPYTPGEQPSDKSLVKLNTNECPYPPSPKAVKAAAEEAQRLHLYADPGCTAAKQALAGALGVQADEVLAGNGSDEVLTLVFAAFCPQGVAFADITYGLYPVLAGLFGLTPVIVPLRENFALLPEDYARLACTVIIANPNAPTGLALPCRQIEVLLRQNPDRLVVVDEAYVDFGAESAVPLLRQYPNLLVTGTFSKSRALAGGRFGYAVGGRELIADLERIRCSFNPYNVNRMTMAAASAAAEDTGYFEECRRKIIATRQRSLQALRALGFEAADSAANFVFVRHPALPGEILYRRLREAGVLVRRWDAPRIKDYLRISIGTDAQMDTLLAALQNILAAGKEVPV